MIRTARRYINPLLWALTGWAVAIIANAITRQWAGRWAPAVHIDEIIIGLAFGAMRYIQREFKIERVYTSHEKEAKVREALTVLQYGSKDGDKDKAVRTILNMLEEQKPMRHRDDSEVAP